jgi:hypothetical protein
VAADSREYPGHKGGSVTGHETRAVVWLRAAGGAVQRAQALPVGVGEPLLVHLAGELGELVHDGHLLSCRWWLVVVSTVATGAGGHHA